MLVVDLLWIVFGVGYIVVKLFKEEPVFTLAFFKMFFGFVLFFLLPIGTISYIAQSDVVSETTSKIFCVLYILYLIGAIAWFLWWLYSPKSKEKDAKKREKLLDETKQKLVQDFCDAGYHVNDKYIAMLVEDLSSPLHTTSKLRIPVVTLYQWLCDQREQYYERMGDEEFNSLLGMDLLDIPLNPHRAKNDAIRQRKELAIKYLMEHDGSGLTLNCMYRPWRIDNTDYPKQFAECVRQAMDRAELDKLQHMSDEELSGLLGLPLNSIPLDGLGLNKILDNYTSEHERRRQYVIAFILRRKGLKYYKKIFTRSSFSYSEYPILETDGGKAFLEYVKSKGFFVDY